MANVQNRRTMKVFLRSAGQLLVKYRNSDGLVARIRRQLRTSRRHFAGFGPRLAPTVSVSTLRRHLIDEGQSYRSIGTTCPTGNSQLCHSKNPCSNVGSLGFAEASAFHRAFKVDWRPDPANTAGVGRQHGQKGRHGEATQIQSRVARRIRFPLHVHISTLFFPFGAGGGGEHRLVSSAQRPHAGACRGRPAGAHLAPDGGRDRDPPEPVGTAVRLLGLQPVVRATTLAERRRGLASLRGADRLAVGDGLLRGLRDGDFFLLLPPPTTATEAGGRAAGPPISSEHRDGDEGASSISMPT